MNVFEFDKEYVANTYARFPVNIVRGKGSLAWDNEGTEYIDLGSGIAVNTFGFSDEAWAHAVCDQIFTFQHTSNLYYTEPCAALAKEICDRCGMKKVFFSNSGAEANETAIKVARKYGRDTKGDEFFTIVTLNNSFHGRTHTTLAATGQAAFHEYFLPLTEGFVHCEPTIEDLEKTISENKVCAIMFELVRGEGGVLPLDKEFVDYIVTVAKEKDLLLIADEVQTGNGRTGKLYSYMHYGFTPDVFTTAKGIGGGLPIGATVLGEKVENIFTPGLNGSTFGANPVCCAGALNIIRRLDGELFEEVTKKSEYIFKAFEGAKGVESVSGLGLMIGIKTEKPAKEIALRALENGILVLTAKDKVRLLPALNIPMELLERAVSVLKEIIAE